MESSSGPPSRWYEKGRVEQEAHMDKRRIAAKLAAAWVPVPVAARRGGKAVASRGGRDCCSKDAVGRRPACAAFCTRAKPPGNPGGGRGPLLQLPRRLCPSRKSCTACRNGPDMTSGEV
jgi:hypothetical protein